MLWQDLTDNYPVLSPECRAELRFVRYVALLKHLHLAGREMRLAVYLQGIEVGKRLLAARALHRAGFLFLELHIHYNDGRKYLSSPFRLKRLAI